MSKDTSYCFCRSSEESYLMICCDFCNEWYHGDCVSITARIAENISKFYCLKCYDRDPSLKTQYYKEPRFESTKKQGTTRKRSKSPSRLNKVARSENDVSFERRNFKDKEDDDQDEILIIEHDLSENNNRNSKPKSKPGRRKTKTSAENQCVSEKTHKQEERKISEIDVGLRECYQWMNQYTFLPQRVHF